MTTTTASTTSRGLFPLPLTPFEYYYWCDDRPEYPTMYPVEYSFSGVLQREPLARALAAALERHPLLGSLVDEGPHGRPVWIGGDGRAPEIDWAPEGTPVSHSAGERIDLRSAPGLRVWGRYSEEDSRLLFQFHHACCDGLGAFRFVEDVLVFYHQEVTGEATAAPRPVDVEQLRTRGRFPPVEGGWRGVIRDWYVGARQWGEIVLREPAPLRVPEPSPEEPRTPIPFLGYETHVLDAAQARRLRLVAGSQEVTMNDLLLRDVFQVVCQWNRRYGQGGNPWLRINMPSSLRQRDDELLPAANRLSFTFLTRRAKACENGAELLAGIHEETEAIKRYHLGWYFLGGLAVASGPRRLIPWFLQRNRSFATLVVSNVGRAFSRAPLPRRGRQHVAGNVLLRRITGVPPVRPLTRAAIAIVTYADETAICLRADPRLYSVEQSRQLLAELALRLEKTASQGK